MLHRIRIALAATPAPARRSEVPDAGTRASRRSDLEEQTALLRRLRSLPAVTLLALAAASAAGTASAATATSTGSSLP